MRRYQWPFNGKKYVLNKNSGVAHNLDNEQTNCQINEIHADHVYASDFLSEIKRHSSYQEECDYCLGNDG